MKLLRIILALAVLAYAGWLAWPMLSPLLDGGAPEMSAMRAEAGAGDLFGVIPSWAVWGAAIGLYAIAALMLGSGNTKAAVAYFLGFIADAVLRLATSQQGGGDVGARSMAAPEAALSGLPVEPVWVVLGVLLLVGVLVVVASRRVRRRREAGQLAF
jgi:hypothetical protein